ncbi:MAG: lipopolysaccharide biosynthesis protein RfbH [Turneriella sp.]
MHEVKIGQVYYEVLGHNGPVVVLSNPNNSNYVQILVGKLNGEVSEMYDVKIYPKDYSTSANALEFILKPSELTYTDSGLLKACNGQLSTEKISEILKNITFLNSETFYRAVHRPAQEELFAPGISKIPYAGRIFNESEIINLIDSSLDFWLTTGRYSELFETEFAQFLGVHKALLVNSGSSANLIAFSALTSPSLRERAIKKGDEVISVAAGFPTTINPILQYGAVPVFVDIDIETHNVDVSKLEEALSPNTKAVMLAHTLGNPFNVAAVKKFCEAHRLWLVEDNCDALGSRYLFNGEWRYTGTIGDIGTSSFYPPHHMTMGEGGAVYTNSPKLKKIAESFRDWGRDCWCASGKDDTCGKRFSWQLGELPEGYDHKYIYSHIGYNLKVTDMQAAIGVAQLKKLPSFIQARKENWKLLRNHLSDLEEFFILPKATTDSDPSWFGFLLTLRDEKKFSRKALIEYLESFRIQTRMLFAGNYLRHPAFDGLRNSPAYRVVGDLTNTDKTMNHSFWLGVYPGMKPGMLEFIAQKIRAFCLR